MNKFKTVDGTYYITEVSISTIMCDIWIQAKTDAYSVKVWVNTSHIVHINQ